MKTADLIAQLAAQAAPAPRAALIRRLAIPVLLGVGVAVISVVLWLGLRPLGEATTTFAFWMKATYTGLLVIPAALVVARLARPGGTIGGLGWMVAVAILMIGILAAAEFLQARPSERMALWLGESASVCPFRILTLAGPIYIGVALGLRRLAPTRLTAAGAAAGFLAGSLGATVYQAHCPEVGAMFVATWYTLGILLSTLIGALIGRRWLRW